VVFGDFLLVSRDQFPRLVLVLRGADRPQRRGRDRLIAAVAVVLHAVKEREQLVIVALRKRVELVVVAAGTVDGQAEKRLAGRGENVVQAVVIGEQRIGRLVVPQTEAVIAGRDDGVGGDLIQLVAGELLADELIVGLVGV